MRKIVLVFIAVVLTVSGFAQKTADIGIWGGTSSYWGDIKGVPPIQTFNLNFGALFRYNFNARAALRMQVLTGGFSSEGTVEDIDYVFDKNAQDISLMMEINYLKYILGQKNAAFTPYIMGGLGVMYYEYLPDSDKLDVINPNYPLNKGNESVISPALAFGFGIKFSAGKRLGVGIEYQMRKLFDDKFDDLDDPLSFDDGGEKIRYTDFLHNNDWPGYLGLNVTYKIDLERKACPAYDRKYW